MAFIIQRTCVSVSSLGWRRRTDAGRDWAGEGEERQATRAGVVVVSDDIRPTVVAHVSRTTYCSPPGLAFARRPVIELK